MVTKVAETDIENITDAYRTIICYIKLAREGHTVAETFLQRAHSL
jgi:hypothetical protein